MVKTFLKSPAKINLSLKIGKKINHQYHDIQSVIFLINLHDQITVKKITGKKDILKFVGKFKNNNLPSIKLLQNRQCSEELLRLLKTF